MFWGTIKNIIPSLIVLVLGLYAAQFMLDNTALKGNSLSGQRVSAIEPAAGTESASDVAAQDDVAVSEEKENKTAEDLEGFINAVDDILQ